MGKLSRLKSFVNQTVRGQYRLTGITHKESTSGKRYLQCQLEDAYGSVDSYAWESSPAFYIIEALTEGAAIEATIRIRQMAELISDIYHIKHIEPDDIANAATLLPLSRCVEQAQFAHIMLIDFIDKLEIDAAKGFMNRVLLDDEIAFGLLSGKADDARPYHTQPGSLLNHSVETAQLCLRLLGSRVNTLEREASLVTALLHDIGKIRTLSNAGNTIFHPMPQHGNQTCRMLETHFQWLRKQAPDLSTAVEYILDYMSLAKETQKAQHPAFLGAEAVVMADQFSTACSKGKDLGLAISHSYK